MKTAQLVAGDQLSLARLRTVHNIQAGKEGGYTGFGWCIPIPGLFHIKMADMHGMFTMHWGRTDAGNHNPGHSTFTTTNYIGTPFPSPCFHHSKHVVILSLSQFMHESYIGCCWSPNFPASRNIPPKLPLGIHCTSMPHPFIQCTPIHSVFLSSNGSGSQLGIKLKQQHRPANMWIKQQMPQP